MKFLLDEHPVLVLNTDWIPKSEDEYERSLEPSKALDQNNKRGGGWWFRVPGSFWPDEMMPLAMILYKYVRCELAHVGELPKNIEFTDNEPGQLKFAVLDDRLQISNSLL